MAIEPKTPRKRAVKKASAKADAPVTEVLKKRRQPVRRPQLFRSLFFKQHLKSLLQRRKQ
jgi:hypothetical protein